MMTFHVPLGREARIAMETRRAEAIEQSAKGQRRWLWKMGLVYLGWLFLGLVIMGFGFHSDNERIGRFFVQLSFFVGYGGMYFTTIWAYVRGKERGDW